MEAYGRKRHKLVAENGVKSVRLPAKIFSKDMLYEGTYQF
jgi:hypothetical protein